MSNHVDGASHYIDLTDLDEKVVTTLASSIDDRKCLMMYVIPQTTEVFFVVLSPELEELYSTNELEEAVEVYNEIGYRTNTYESRDDIGKKFLKIREKCMCKAMVVNNMHTCYHNERERPFTYCGVENCPKM